MDNLAFLISCEEYVRDDFKSLSGIKEDVPKMKAALIEHGGILEKNCYCLCQSEDAKGGPTEPEIWKLFEMPNSSIEYGAIYIYYSGHGFQNRDNELCITTRDSRLDPYPMMYIKIEEIVSFLKTTYECKHIIFILDMCQTFIHYVFNAAWELPFIMWKIFHALYTLSVFKILCVDIGGIIIFKLLIYAYKMTDALYFQKAKSYKNIDTEDLKSLPIYIETKLAVLDIKKYKQNMKKDLDFNEHLIIGWRNYTEMDGLVLGSDNGSETTYFCMMYKKWPRVKVCCVGARTFREKCIYTLNCQGFEYTGCDENILHFRNIQDIEINILYGKRWPEAIEIKRKESPGRLREWFFYHNFIYTDEKGKKYKCEFWGTEEYKQNMYVIVSICLRENGQLVKRPLIIKKEKEDYIMAELSEAEAVFELFTEKHTYKGEQA